MRTAALLSHESILRVHRTAVSAGLTTNRVGLLAGLPRNVVASLPQSTVPSEQLLSDLDALNKAAPLADHTLPLAVWLKNAVALASVREEASTFEQVLDELPASTAIERGEDSASPIEQPRLPSSGPLALKLLIVGVAAAVGACLLFLLFRRPPSAEEPGPAPPINTSPAPSSSGVVCADSADLRGVRLTIEAENVLSFDLLDLNGAGVRYVAAGDRRHAPRRDGLRVLELRSEKGPVRVALVASTDRKGQSLNLRPERGTLVTRVGLANGADATFEGAVEIYVATAGAVEILHDVALLRVDGERACWGATRLKSLRIVDGELQVTR